jgi:hypothetical protein
MTTNGLVVTPRTCEHSLIRSSFMGVVNRGIKCGVEVTVDCFFPGLLCSVTVSRTGTIIKDEFG